MIRSPFLYQVNLATGREPCDRQNKAAFCPLLKGSFWPTTISIVSGGTKGPKHVRQCHPKAIQLTIHVDDDTSLQRRHQIRVAGHTSIDRGEIVASEVLLDHQLVAYLHQRLAVVSFARRTSLVPILEDLVVVVDQSRAMVPIHSRRGLRKTRLAHQPNILLAHLERTGQASVSQRTQGTGGVRGGQMFGWNYNKHTINTKPCQCPTNQTYQSD